MAPGPFVADFCFLSHVLVPELHSPHKAANPPQEGCKAFLLPIQVEDGLTGPSTTSMCKWMAYGLQPPFFPPPCATASQWEPPEEFEPPTTPTFSPFFTSPLVLNIL